MGSFHLVVRVFRGIAGHADIRTVLQAGYASVLEHQLEFLGDVVERHVITSYSIHYTKLYDVQVAARIVVGAAAAGSAAETSIA